MRRAPGQFLTTVGISLHIENHDDLEVAQRGLGYWLRDR